MSIIANWRLQAEPVLHWQLTNSSLVVHMGTGTQHPFYGHLSRTTWVSRYQKKHSSTHAYLDQQSSCISFLHLQRSIASSLLTLRADFGHHLNRLSKFIIVYCIKQINSCANFETNLTTERFCRNVKNSLQRIIPLYTTLILRFRLKSR